MATAVDCFNPPWMRTAAPLRVDKGSLYKGPESDDPSKADMMAPIFAQHRYGREDILAMLPKSTEPPDGLLKCQFFVEEVQLPIILSSLNETELRLQNNINSSKALSLLTHQERLAINGIDNGTGGASPASPFKTPGAVKTAKPGSRWSALTSNDSPPGGAGYVKAGMRGCPSSNGRGGGTVGRGGRNGGYDTTRAGTRTNLRSNIGDDSPQKPPNKVEKCPTEKQPKGVIVESPLPIVQESRPLFSYDEDDLHRAQQEAERRHLEQKARDAMEALHHLETSRFKENNYLDDVELMKSIGSSCFPPVELDVWYYLAPNNVEQGPYTGLQMMSWYKFGFFQINLRCRSSSQKHYTTLGELIQKHGIDNPFDDSVPIGSIPSQHPFRNPFNDYYDAHIAMVEENNRKDQELFELQKKELFDLQRKPTASKPSSPWTGTTITSTVAPKRGWSNNKATPSPISARANPLFNNNIAWPAIPPATPSPKAERPKSASQSWKQKAEPLKQEDPLQQFQDWAIKGIIDLNKTVNASVDPEMFFGFIKDIADPFEFDDYFATYFGERYEVKEFQKKFLEKRIALRSKQKNNDKDDLSAAQAAVNVPNQTASGKKKKGKSQMKTVDVAVLGFKTGGDPNRTNVGKIDTAFPDSNWH